MSLQDALREAIDANASAKKFVKNILGIMLGDEKAEARFPVLEQLIDNCELLGSPTIIGKAFLSMSDEEFNALKELSLKEQLCSVLKSNSN